MFGRAIAIFSGGNRMQLVRYVLVGLGSNALLYAGYLLLTYMGLGYNLSMTLMFATGVLLTFVANRNWSFRELGARRYYFVRYICCYLLCYVLNLFLLRLGTHWGFDHRLVQAVAIFVVGLCLFSSIRLFVFLPGPKVT